MLSHFKHRTEKKSFRENLWQFFTLDFGLLAGTWGPLLVEEASSVSMLLSSSPPSGVVACPPEELLEAVEWSVAASSQLSAAAAPPAAVPPPPPAAVWEGLLSMGVWLPGNEKRTDMTKI